MWRVKEYRGKWYAVTRQDGKTKRVSLRTSDRDAADRQFADFIKSGEIKPETVSDILDAWRREKDHLASTKTIDHAFKAIKPHFGQYRPDQVTRLLCRQYIKARQEKGRKNGTIRRELDILRSGLRWHDRNTPAVIELPPQSPPKDRYLTRDEYSRLLAAAKSPHITLFIILALSTAGRAGAILDLTWDRIDFEKGLIDLNDGQERKTKRRALVPMTKSARAALLKAYEARQTDYVIEYAGKRVNAIKKAFKRTAITAGMKDVTPHVLRHTAAVWMAENGVPMSEISQYLGHSSTSITERVYARYSPDYLRGAARALEI